MVLVYHFTPSYLIVLICFVWLKLLILPPISTFSLFQFLFCATRVNPLTRLTFSFYISFWGFFWVFFVGQSVQYLFFIVSLFFLLSFMLSFFLSFLSASLPFYSLPFILYNISFVCTSLFMPCFIRFISLSLTFYLHLDIHLKV